MVKDWLESVYATVRYWVDPGFRRQVKMFRNMIERSMVGAGCTCYWRMDGDQAVFVECESCEDWV